MERLTCEEKAFLLFSSQLKSCDCLLGRKSWNGFPWINAVFWTESAFLFFYIHSTASTLYYVFPLCAKVMVWLGLILLVKSDWMSHDKEVCFFEGQQAAALPQWNTNKIAAATWRHPKVAAFENSLCAPLQPWGEIEKSCSHTFGCHNLFFGRSRQKPQGFLLLLLRSSHSLFHIINEIFW